MPTQILTPEPDPPAERFTFFSPLSVRAFASKMRDLFGGEDTPTPVGNIMSSGSEDELYLYCHHKGATPVVWFRGDVFDQDGRTRVAGYFKKSRVIDTKLGALFFYGGIFLGVGLLLLFNDAGWPYPWILVAPGLIAIAIAAHKYRQRRRRLIDDQVAIRAFLAEHFEAA